MSGGKTYRPECRSQFGAWGGVVNCDSSIIASLELVRNLRDPFVAAVASAEVQVCGPVVAEVLCEVAGCACREFRDVGIWH